MHCTATYSPEDNKLRLSANSVTVFDNWGNGGANFTRTIPFDKLQGVMTRAEVEGHTAAGRVVAAATGCGFYVTTDAPPAPKPAREADPKTEGFDQLKDALRAGVTVISAPQLFPTPPEVARRVVELADLRPGLSVLEPSAGTGSLIRAIREACAAAEVTAVEINPTLPAGIARLVGASRCADFLELNGELGTFDRIVMNPPFSHGADIDHIRHAFGKLNPGGRLVTVCANGPRQREELGEICTHWIDLPAGSFQEQGTNANTAIVVIDG